MATPHFLNVDLDIESKSNLSILETELGRKVINLGPGPVRPGHFQLRLETVPEYATPDLNIHAFCSMLEKLSLKAKRAWRSAQRKEFDIGHDVVDGQLTSQFSLSQETLERVAALGASVGITFYHRSNSELNASSTLVGSKLRRK